jgi:hypothetical protein
MLKEFPTPPELQDLVILKGQPPHPERLNNVASTGDNKETNDEISGLNKKRKWEHPEEVSKQKCFP